MSRFWYNDFMKEIEVISRTVILDSSRILLCKGKGDYYSLPGGHVEFGETAEAALRRELMEELGAEVKSAKFIGSQENVFDQDGKRNHEFNFVFLVVLKSNEVRAAEDHLEFVWQHIETANYLPKELCVAVRKWRGDKEAFWLSSVT